MYDICLTCKLQRFYIKLLLHMFREQNVQNKIPSTLTNRETCNHTLSNHKIGCADLEHKSKQMEISALWSVCCATVVANSSLHYEETESVQ